MIENLIKKKDGEYAIVTLTKKRLKHNLNMICMFTGKTGAGKTWSGISYAQSLDPEFKVNEQIVFDFKQCMDIINSDWFKKKKIKIVLWDEPQISISNRSWQSQMNRLVNFLLSTFRHQNIVLILCTPYKDFLDSQTMKLVHWEFQCSTINKKNNTCTVFPKWQQYNPQKKKTYPHSLNVIINNNRIEMKTWHIKKPTKDAIEIYENNKTSFTDKLNKKIMKDLEAIEKADEITDEEKKDELSKMQKPILKCWEEGIFKQKDIAKKLKKQQSFISVSEESMRKKGFIKKQYQK